MQLEWAEQIRKFQSTPSQRGRLKNRGKNNKNCYFNPRPRKEGDSTNNRFIGSVNHFNPRPRKEGDIDFDCVAHFNGRFQSTPSQRGRLLQVRQAVILLQFQSTPSQRGRPNTVYPKGFMIFISIHALAKRATIYPILCVFCILISIHALAKRATGGLTNDKRKYWYFNPRPRKEGDNFIVREH